jgi:hypothetical protein
MGVRGRDAERTERIASPSAIWLDSLQPSLPLELIEEAVFSVGFRNAIQK